MQSINQIELKHIENLSDIQLSELLHKLLRTEAQKNSLEGWKVFVPFKINSADGGEDGHITWEGQKEKTHWVYNRNTIFQNKATNLSPSDCKEEILESKREGQPRKLKSQIEEIVNKEGCYILFTNQHYTEIQKVRRINKFREAIKETGHVNIGVFLIFIYDANSIKDWVNENIAAITFVQLCNNITRIQGFRIWEEWNRDMQASEIPYQTNEVILKNINFIRNSIKVLQIIRIIGHSGLGKTRLVLEAFRETSDYPEIKALSFQLVYYDLSFGNIDNIAAYIISHKKQQSGIIVVDNCSEESHHTIAGLVRDGGFKIITIDFSSKTNEKSSIKLDRNNQRDIVRLIVENIFKDNLSLTDKEIIAKQSEGYPQMAILFSESVKAEGVTELNSKLPSNFLKKLIFAREGESEFEYEIIKSCSVLSKFGFNDSHLSDILDNEKKLELERQTSFVRDKICGPIEGRSVSPKDFFRICIKYKESNIIEQRGTYIMVKPTPLAISLAAMWWEETPDNIIFEIINDLRDDVLGEYLVERLSQLDQLDIAKEIVNNLWGPQSPFGKAKVLNTALGSLLFRYVVEVNPMSTVQSLESTFGNFSIEELKNIEEGRRNLIWALEKLCFRKETFMSAAKILYAFAVAENENIGNNATNQFIHLFQLFLSGTEASLIERLEIIKWGMQKEEDEYIRIAILAMGRGLLNEHYMRFGGMEKQGSLILKDYTPNWEEIFLYWDQIMKYLVGTVSSYCRHAKLAKEQISNAIRTLIRDGKFDLVNDTIRKIQKTDDKLWMDAYKSLKLTLLYEKHLSEAIKEKITILLEELTPKDVRNQIYLIVTNSTFEDFEKNGKGNYIDKPKLIAEKFAKRLIEENIEWQTFIPDLLTGEQNQAYNFGKVLGNLERKEKREEILNDCLAGLKNIAKEKQNPDFIAGFLSGCGDNNIFEKVLYAVISEEKLRHHSFYLVRTVFPTYKNIIKLFVLIDEYNFPIHSFESFKYGKVLDGIDDNHLIILIERIIEYGDSGRWTALSLLFMYCYMHEGRWNNSAIIFRNIISETNLTLYKGPLESMNIYRWYKTVIQLLEFKRDENLAQIITNQIVEFCSDDYFDYSFDIAFANIFEILVQKYFLAVWEILGNGLIGDYITFFHLAHFLGSKNDPFSRNEGILFRNPENYSAIITWCREKKGIAPISLAQMMPLSIKVGDKIRWHDFSKLLIDEFGNNEKFLNVLSSNMGTFGSVGSSIPYYETQKTLLQELVDHKYEKVRNWAKKMLKYTIRRIKIEKINDEEFSIT